MGARVLLIEDNMHDRSLVAFLLEVFGHASLIASDGEEGVSVALEESPDLILLDILLPGIDGYETLAALRAHGQLAETPIVAVTVLTSPGQRESLLAAGFDGYIPKPLLPQLFADQLDEFVAPELRSIRPGARSGAVPAGPHEGE